MKTSAGTAAFFRFFLFELVRVSKELLEMARAGRDALAYHTFNGRSCPLRMRLLFYAHTHRHTHIHTHTHTHTYTHTHTHTHTQVFTCIRAYIRVVHTYIHACMHTYIHTYIHIHTCMHAHAPKILGINGSKSIQMDTSSSRPHTLVL